MTDQSFWALNWSTQSSNFTWDPQPRVVSHQTFLRWVPTEDSCHVPVPALLTPNAWGILTHKSKKTAAPLTKINRKFVDWNNTMKNLIQVTYLELCILSREYSFSKAPSCNIYNNWCIKPQRKFQIPKSRTLSGCILIPQLNRTK